MYSQQHGHPGSRSHQHHGGIGGGMMMSNSPPIGGVHPTQNLGHPASQNLGGGGLAGPSMGATLAGASLATGMAPSGDDKKNSIFQLVLDLTVPEKRENALLELSKKREKVPDLAPILWHSFGTMAALLQEIVSIYPLLSPPALTAHASNRVCNALVLLQCVASHPETRSLFLNAHIPLFLYPFLNTVSKTKPFEFLRLTSLGVIGALVRMDDPDVINFLLSTEIIPLCLRIMETGIELPKTVATFIVQKILLDEMGLAYMCATYERFFAVSSVLSNMVAALQEQPSPRLLKHIIRCYLRLTDNPRAREALRACLPDVLKDMTLAQSNLKDDPATKRCWIQLLVNVNGEAALGSAAGGMMATPLPTGGPGLSLGAAAGPSLEKRL